MAMDWKTQARYFNTTQKFNINLCLPEFSATRLGHRNFTLMDPPKNIWYDHGKGSTYVLKIRHKIIKNTIEGGKGPYEG